MGLLERRRHPADRRANALYPTPRTRSLLSGADREAQIVDDELLAPLGNNERTYFTELLRRVADGAGLAEGVHPDDGDAPTRARVERS